MGVLSSVFSFLLLWKDFKSDKKFHLPENHEYVKAIRIRLIEEFETKEDP